MDRENCKHYLGCGECGFDEQAYTRCLLGSHHKQCNLYEAKERHVGYPADMDMTQVEIMKAEYRLNMPKPIGRLIHEPTRYSLAVYKPISRFTAMKSAMLKLTTPRSVLSQAQNTSSPYPSRRGSRFCQARS